MMDLNPLSAVSSLQQNSFGDVNTYLCLETWDDMMSWKGENLDPKAVDGFIGGSVGVVGSIVATLLKKTQVKERLKCTYCEGTGDIICGICLERGTVKVKDDSGQWVMKECSNCEASGTVVCINCQGSGRAVPDEFLQVLGDSEAGFSDDDYIGLFDEVKFPNPPQNAEGADEADAGASKAPTVASDTVPTTLDPSEGMG